MKITLKPIVPKARIFNATRFQSEINKAKLETKDGIQQDYEKTVSTWNHKPRFYTTRRGNDWFIGTKDEIYGYVEMGTKPHTITVKRAKFLRFFAGGFQPKSRVNWIGSGPGRRASKNFVQKKSVQHPGTKARNFSKEIKKKWQKLWLIRVQQAIRNAIQGSR